MINGFSLGLLSFCLLSTAILFWFRFLTDLSLGGRRPILYVGVAAAVAMGIASLTMNPGWVGGTLATLSIVGGSVWAGLGLLAGQSSQTSELILGEPLPAFSAPDHTDQRFEIESLRGHPVLIKLFRGHW